MRRIQQDSNVRKFIRILRLYTKALFNRFDKELSPEVTLLWFSTDNERLNCGVIPDYAPDVKRLKEAMDDVEKHIHLDDLSIETLFEQKDTLMEMLNLELIEHTDATDDQYIVYRSNMALISDIIVLVQVKISKQVYRSYYELVYDVDQGSRSILEALGVEMMNDINKLLLQFSTHDTTNSIDFNETIRKAAKLFLRVLGFPGIWDNTFDKLNKISAMHYESEANHGRILFLSRDEVIKEDSELLDIELLFSSKVPLANYRHIRKLLEISRKGVYLISDAEYIYGIGNLKEGVDYAFERVYTIEFTNYYSWQLVHNKKNMMLVNHEQVSIPRAKVSYVEFTQELKRIYPLKTAEILDLYRIVLEATKQSHGALIVISRNARSEASRLKSQCFMVKPKRVHPSTIESITSIDGAILIDVECIIHGIGVILDGMATNRGDSSRGARYNSAIRYVETISKNNEYSDVMAVVISEDGYVDIVTKHTM